MCVCVCVCVCVSCYIPQCLWRSVSPPSLVSRWSSASLQLPPRRSPVTLNTHTHTRAKDEEGCFTESTVFNPSARKIQEFRTVFYRSTTHGLQACVVAIYSGHACSINAFQCCTRMLRSFWSKFPCYHGAYTYVLYVCMSVPCDTLPSEMTGPPLSQTQLPWRRTGCKFPKDPGESYGWMCVCVCV